MKEDFIKKFPELFPAYRYESDLFFLFCRASGIDWTEQAVRSYRNSLPRTLKHGTYNKRLAAAKKVVLEWIKQTDPERYPAAAFHLKDISGMKKADKSVDPGRWHTTEQINSLLDRAGKKTATIIYFLVCTGLRRSEAIGITYEDIKTSGAWSYIRINGKGNKERTIPVPSRVVDKVINVFSGDKYLLETRGGNPYDPDKFSAMVTAAGRKIGIRTSPHRMRHTFATRFLAENPGKFKELSLHLGHSSIQITMDNYAHNQMETGDLERSTEVYRL